MSIATLSHATASIVHQATDKPHVLTKQTCRLARQECVPVGSSAAFVLIFTSSHGTINRLSPTRATIAAAVMPCSGASLLRHTAQQNANNGFCERQC